MSYQLHLNPKPEKALHDLPEPLRSYVYRELHNLAQSPTALSKRTTSTHPSGQLFEIEYETVAVHVLVSVTFKYSQDGISLIVESMEVEFA